MKGQIEYEYDVNLPARSASEPRPNNKTAHATEDIQVRREILGLLHEASKSSVLGRLSLNILTKQLNVSRKVVQFHLDYLEKKEWIALDRSVRGVQVFYYYSITPKGIDLVEEPSEFNRELPVVQHIQYGDTITVGNIIGSKGVAIGPNAHAEVTEGISAEDLQKLFEVIKAQIAEYLAEVTVSREEIEKALDELEKAVQEVEIQIAQGESPDETFLKQRLQNVGRMSPDILQVAAATLTNPLAGLSLAVKKIAQKAAEEASEQQEG